MVLLSSGVNLSPATPELQLAKGADSLNGRRVISDGTFSEYSPQKVKVPLGPPSTLPHWLNHLQWPALILLILHTNPKIAQSLIESGALSDAQLEVVTYAGQSFEQVMPNGSRMGFFIGDGTGVGKGREIAGIILDQWNRGNKKGCVGVKEHWFACGCKTRPVFVRARW